MFAYCNVFIRAAAVTVALLLAMGSVQAQTPTTLSYQGEVVLDGAPLTGQVDLRAQLFTAATEGTPVGEAIELANVTVTNGLFTALLDFGNAFDAGQPRWLEISVRSPAGSGPFATLSPRQPITAAPLAQGLAGIALTRGGPEELDQAQDGFIGIANLLEPGVTWQSWTPRLTGNLTRLQVRGLGTMAPATEVTVRIYYGVGTSGPLMSAFTTSIPFSTNSLREIVIPNVPVQSGTPYTFAFTGQAYLEPATDRIPGASANRFDIWFRTFVTPVRLMDITSSNALVASLAFAATSVPWSGITGVPANVAASPWSAVGNGIVYNVAGNGNVGVGTAAPDAKLHIGTGSLGTGQWQTLFSNAAVPAFRGGLRLADSGFFEVTNNASMASPNFARLASTGAWSAVSDGRLKTDVTSADGNLAAAMKLRPVNFRWKGDGAEDIGLIAQEVRGVLPRLVAGDEASESLTVNYSQLSVVAIGAIQELKAENDRKQHEIDELRARLAAMEATLKRMEEDGK